VLNACKCAFVAYFGNGNLCTVRGGGQFLSFRMGIPDGPGGSVIYVLTGVTSIV